MCRAGAVAMLKAFVLAAVLCEVPKDNSSQVYCVDSRHGNSTRSHPPKMCFSGQLIVVPAAHMMVESSPENFHFCGALLQLRMCCFSDFVFLELLASSVFCKCCQKRCRGFQGFGRRIELDELVRVSRSDSSIGVKGTPSIDRDVQLARPPVLQNVIELQEN